LYLFVAGNALLPGLRMVVSMRSCGQCRASNVQR
jgi:hypothetical protein